MSLFEVFQVAISGRKALVMQELFFEKAYAELIYRMRNGYLCNQCFHSLPMLTF